MKAESQENQNMRNLLSKTEALALSNPQSQDGDAGELAPSDCLLSPC